MVRRLLVGGTVVLLVGAALGAFGCISDFYEGVHFHNGDPDFGIAPRRANLYWEGDSRPAALHEGKQDGFGSAGTVGMELRLGGRRVGRGERATTSTVSACAPDEPAIDVEPNNLAEQEEADLKKRLQVPQADVQAGNWRKALDDYRNVAGAVGWGHGSLRDRVEVLQSYLALPVARSAPLTEPLRSYLAALDLDDAGQPGKTLPVYQKLGQEAQSGFLREHAIYQEACVSHSFFKYDQAIAQYQKFLAAYPKSSKREATLMMIARCAILPKTQTMQAVPVGEQALKQLVREFPHTRFRTAAEGLKARVLLLKHEYRKAFDAYAVLKDAPSALEVVKSMPNPTPVPLMDLRADLMALYLRRLDRAKSYNRYVGCVTVIRRISEQMSAQEARRFRLKLMAADDLAAPYFYYRLNHCTNDKKALAHLAQLADQFAERHSRSKLPPSVRVRLAEVYYRNGRYDRALEWAESGLHTASRDRALYVCGAVQSHRGRTGEAIADFEALLHDFPSSGLRNGARENLALLYERRGDLASALDQYFALNYTLDVAYMLDARMTTQQVADYCRREAEIANSPAKANGDWRTVRRVWISDRNRWDGDDTQKKVQVLRTDLLTYTLGIRQLRDGRWADAEATFHKVPSEVYDHYSSQRKKLEYSSRTVPEPISVARDLAHLERAARQAAGGKSGAEALYDYANYYGDHGTLLFYNPGLWGGAREFSFQFYWNEGFSDAGTRAVIRKHMMEHEVYPRARELFQRVATEYPQSPLAPKALYRAAVACHRLSRFNYWWVDVEGKTHNYAQEALRLKKQLIKRYPNDPYARQARRKPSDEGHLDWTTAATRRTEGNRVGSAN